MLIIGYRRLRYSLAACAALVLSLFWQSAHAEYFGLPNGRLADFDTDRPLSVEVGMVTGKLAEVDYNNPTLRINYLLRKQVQVYADLSQASVGRLDETSFGVGAYYGLGQLFNFADSFALKGSIHSIKLGRSIGSTLVPYCTGPMPVVNPFDGSLTIDPGICSTTLVAGSSSSNNVRAISLEFLISGRSIDSFRIKNNPVYWYFNTGMHMFNGSNLDTQLGFGAGLVVPFSRGEFYGGLDFLDDPLLGFGLRYFVD